MLKDIVNHPESNLKLNFSSYDNSECPNEINNLVNDEESTNVKKTLTFLDCDKESAEILFKSVAGTLEAILKELVTNKNYSPRYIGSKR